MRVPCAALGQLASVFAIIAVGTVKALPDDSSQPGVHSVPLFEYETRVFAKDDLRQIPPNLTHLFAPNTKGPILQPGDCKPLPSDAGWPTEAEWTALNDTLHGKLIATVPIGARCSRDWGAVHDEKECEVLLRDWTDPWMHEEDPTSAMWPAWQGLTCMPEDVRRGSSCTLGAFPSYVVNATSVADVQIAVNFARNRGVRLVIKNTGHDYMGKSTGAGALSIWTHNLQGVDYLPHYESGEYASRALHVGAGVRGRDLYAIAEEKNATIVGGMCESVGFAGGYFSGGGHSPMSGVLGMAADHILAIGLVAASGQFLTVTEETYPDLFWAIRGGGGGTFGVVTSVVVRLHPQMQVTTSRFGFRTSESVDGQLFWLGMRELLGSFERFAEAGFYSYIYLQRDGLDTDSYSLSIESTIAPNRSIESYQQVMEPLFVKLKDLGIPYTDDPRNYPSAHQALVGAWPEGIDLIGMLAGTWGTRLFSKEVWNDPLGFEEIMKSIKTVCDGGYQIIAWSLSPGNPFNVDNAVNPAFRHARAFLGTGVLFPKDPTPDEKSSVIDELMSEVLVHWKKAAPASKFGGSYLNEGSIMEADWQDDFYGDNYPRLLRIKKVWDPQGLFYATTGVGSEEWEVRTEEQGIQTQNGPLCRRNTVVAASFDEEQVVLQEYL